MCNLFNFVTPLENTDEYATRPTRENATNEVFWHLSWKTHCVMDEAEVYSCWSAEVVGGINVRPDVEIFHWISSNLTCRLNWTKTKGGLIFKGP